MTNNVVIAAIAVHRQSRLLLEPYSCLIYDIPNIVETNIAQDQAFERARVAYFNTRIQSLVQALLLTP